MRSVLRVLLSVLCTTSVLSGCDSLPEWMGGGDDKPALAGTRIPILADITQVKPDPALAPVTVTVPPPQSNAAWGAEGGGAASLVGNLAWSGSAQQDSTTIGDGNGWKQFRNVSPVVAGSLVFAMDAKGFITAHDAVHIATQKWTNKSVVEQDEPDIMGGGVAVEGGKLFAATGYGKAVALDAASGKELWKTNVGVPLRNAPKVMGNKFFVLSADNQLFVLDARNGAQLWSHRGMSENVGFITSVSPAVKDSIVLAPYSSGEIHALDVETGQEVWADTLILSRHTTATGGFSGIGGTPVVADDTVYTGDSGGFFAAIALLSGRRVWEQDVPTLNPAWVAGDFVYILSDTQQLACLNRADGRVKWVQQLPRFGDENKRKDPLVWRGPVMAAGQLLVAGQHGVMLQISPKDGAIASSVDIPEGISDVPVVAGGRLYFITQNAVLHSLY